MGEKLDIYGQEWRSMYKIKMLTAMCLEGFESQEELRKRSFFVSRFKKT